MRSGNNLLYQDIFSFSMMLYRFIADVVVVLHCIYVGFVVIGMLLILIGIMRRWRWVRNFWFRGIHFLMIGIVIAQSLVGVMCPLTTWEDGLRVRAGDQGDPGSFIGRWVHRLLFWDAPEWAFTMGYSVFGAAVFVTLILAPPRPPWRAMPAKPRQPI